MGQEFQVPAVFQNKAMSGAFATALNAQDDNLADGIGQSYAVIGYKGKVWSLRHRGQRHNFIRPDDGTPAAYLDVIVLQQAKVKAKSYYKKYEPGTSDGERPVCASIDGIVPDADVQQKQCESCALCPRNVWKTDPVTNRKGRECTDYKRLAVLILPTQTKPLLGEPLMEAAFLRVPPASLNSLAIMGDTMAAQGFHYSSYITRITFDPNKSWPEMIFRPLQQLTDGEAPVILKLREDPLSSRITGGDLASLGQRAVQLAIPSRGVETGLASLAAPSSQDKSNGQTTTQSPSIAAAQAATLITDPSVSKPAAPVGPTPSTQPASSSAAMVDTGLGGAMSAGTATPSDASSPPTTVAPSLAPALADAGEPEESDADLDARIAALITK